MEFNMSIDAKGRLNFPSKLREELGDTFFVTRTVGAKCLKVYSDKEWKSLVEKINAAPQTEIAMLRRFLIGGKQKVEPDKQGRFVVSQALREYAEIASETEVAVLDLEGYAEIWNKANLGAYTGDEDVMMELAAKYGA
ncbi:MAG: division/cell wall cluster transcriptional repressor MraZ [Oscillospiraceae bacterium]|nr:division/cell wall cluster transcriptional repressor MraZ [Oscillospiraceae bacterium]